MLTQRSVEKGQNAREQAQRDYEDRKTRRDEQEQARLDKLAKKNLRNTVARNLDGIGNGGFFASLGGDENPTCTPEGTCTPSAVLDYLRGRLRDANTKEPLRATKLSAPSGVHASAITKLSNRVHKEVLNDESHVACLEIPQGRVWFTYICHYSTWATEVLSKCIVCPKGGCYSSATRPGDVTMYDLQCACPHNGLVLPSVNYCISAWPWGRLMGGLGFLPSRLVSEPPSFELTMCRLVLFFFCFANFGLT